MFSVKQPSVAGWHPNSWVRRKLCSRALSAAKQIEDQHRILGRLVIGQCVRSTSHSENVPGIDEFDRKGSCLTVTTRCQKLHEASSSKLCSSPVRVTSTIFALYQSNRNQSSPDSWIQEDHHATDRCRACRSPPWPWLDVRLAYYFFVKAFIIRCQ